ncbi:MAG: transposase [Opitutales bacterium]|nr:transposase [Opitutales bacterium]
MPRAGVGGGLDAIYHVVSRVCGRAFLLSDVEKEAFRGLLGRVAGFCGLEVITYALMENHFHLLIEVPGQVGDLSDEVLLARARLLYGEERKGQPLSMARIEGALRAGGEVREAMRALLIGRMGALPMFMKILKQRYSILFNRKYDRAGTLWEGRFRSVLVENTRAAVRMVAAYIDLNPVRAGVVDDPKDYRFSGYGAAMGSGEWKTYGLWARIRDQRSDSVVTVAARYREFLFVSGSDPRKGGTVSPIKAAAVKERRGGVSIAEMLGCRLRYMTQGAVIGTQSFVDAFVRARSEKGFVQRAKGAVQVGECEGEACFAANGRM